MRAMLITLFATALVSSGTTTKPAQATVATDCVTLQPSQIGQLPLTVGSITFTEWTAKDFDASELVGFRTRGSAHIEVTAGGETWVTNGSWLQPRGVVGPRAAAISSIRVCAADQLAQL